MLPDLSSGFHFIGFRNNSSSTEHGRQPCVQPATWRTRSLYLCPPVTRWSSYTPQVPGSLFVAFYYSQGYGGDILIRLHMGSWNYRTWKSQLIKLKLWWWRQDEIVIDVNVIEQMNTFTYVGCITSMYKINMNFGKNVQKYKKLKGCIKRYFGKYMRK
jgi:hypothetical protein